MSKKLLAKYYQENKERLQKEAHERYQNFLKKKKKKSDNEKNIQVECRKK